MRAPVGQVGRMVLWMSDNLRGMRNEGERTQSIICLVVTACFLLSLVGSWGVIKITGGQIWPLNYIVPIVFGLFVSLIACVVMRFVIRKLSVAVFLVVLAVVLTLATGCVFIGLMSSGWIAY
jgi:uncharacterized protein YacL